MPDSPSQSASDVQSEARGPHWIARITPGASVPERPLVFVGETREKAEANARQFARQTRY